MPNVLDLPPQYRRFSGGQSYPSFDQPAVPLINFPEVLAAANAAGNLAAFGPLGPILAPDWPGMMMSMAADFRNILSAPAQAIANIMRRPETYKKDVTKTKMPTESSFGSRPPLEEYVDLPKYRGTGPLHDPFLYHGLGLDYRQTSAQADILEEIARSGGMTQGMFSTHPNPMFGPLILGVDRRDLPPLDLTGPGVWNLDPDVEYRPQWKSYGYYDSPVQKVPANKLYLVDSKGNIIAPVAEPPPGSFSPRGQQRPGFVPPSKGTGSLERYEGRVMSRQIGKEEAFNEFNRAMVRGEITPEEAFNKMLAGETLPEQKSSWLVDKLKKLKATKKAAAPKALPKTMAEAEPRNLKLFQKFVESSLAPEQIQNLNPASEEMAFQAHSEGDFAKAKNILQSGAVADIYDPKGLFKPGMKHPVIQNPAIDPEFAGRHKQLESTFTTEEWAGLSPEMKETVFKMYSDVEGVSYKDFMSFIASLLGKVE